jgi:hypothetical protein
MSFALKEQFQVTSRFKMWSYILMGIGIVSLLVGFFMYGAGHDAHHKARFWSTLLHNSVYFLLVVNASMFFVCVTTLAWGGWQMSFRRVPEAISTAVIPLGIISLIVLVCLVATDPHIYHWLHPHGDKILEGKSSFLNSGFFYTWTVLAIGLWTILGIKMRKLSRELDEAPVETVAEGKKYIFKNTVWAAIFIVWFALTVASTIPWLWLMSIDAHWYSTMYSWYTFASSFVSGMSLIALFVVYLKNKGYLEVVNEEHLHDLGKFMFAFSVFWTYLWFSQYMLIWYANIPEETVYFLPRVKGPYKYIFFLNLIINFLAPLLILMRRSSKRNYTTITIMAVLIIFCHWLDFYQMVFPGNFKEHVELNLFDFGIAAGFVGIIMFATGRALSKSSLYAKNHPFFKESVIHHT